MPCDISAGGFTVTLPNAPANGARVGVKVINNAPGNALTVTCQGTDRINEAGGNTTLTAQQLNQGTILQYDAGIWYVTADSRPLSNLFNYRGIVAASTAYNPGDVLVYKGSRVYVTTAFTTGSGNPPFVSSSNYVPITSYALYFASDFGVTADGATDNSTALNNALQFVYNAGGGILQLPPGYAGNGGIVATSKTIIIPPAVILAGQGMEATELRLLANANCDVVQFQTYNSAYQAGILGVSASSLKNAFYAGLANLTVHGAASGQGYGTYNYGVNMTISPQSSTAPGDPDFDPYNWLVNVEIRTCTGDGFYHSGRGGLRAAGVLSRYNNGWGFVPSFDSIYTACNAGQNGIGGVYLNHASCHAAGFKLYNNGRNPVWVSGSNYAAGAFVMYSGAMYQAKNALTGDTTAPSSDAANWAAVASTAPQGWGYGLYIDSVTREADWSAIDGQQNSAGDVYLHGCTGVRVAGVSNSPNYSQATSSQNTANPNYYASLTLDGATGCVADLAVSQLASGGVYPLRALNSATGNDVRLAGDTAVTAVVSPDSIALPGSGNRVQWNGTAYARAGHGAATSAVSVAAGAGESVLGTFTVPANLPAGATWRLTAWGTVTVGATSGTSQWRARIGGLTGTQLASVTTSGLTASVTYNWRAQAEVTVQTPGSSGTWAGVLTLQIAQAGAGATVLIAAASVTANSTVSNAFVITTAQSSSTATASGSGFAWERVA